MCLFQQQLKFLHAPVAWIDRLIITDIVPIVIPRAGIHGRNPNHIHSQSCKIVQLADDPANITNPVSIFNSRIRNPFYVHRAYFYPKKLDENVMNAAARAFEGTHDFRAVRSVGTETKTTVRTIYYCHVTRSGDLLELKVCANGFLYNMVRAITGTVLYAAEGKLTPEDIPVILESGNRTLAGPTVPPGGLYLTKLWYEDERLNDD